MGNSDLIAIQCANPECKKKIVVQKAFLREEMYCTLGCLEAKSNAAESAAIL